MRPSRLHVQWLILRDHVSRAARDSVRFAQHHMPMLGWAAAICLIGYYFIWTAVYPEDYESFTVRFIGAVVSIPAILSKKHERRMQHWLPLYWTLGVTYVLPYVFGYMLAQNAAHASFEGQTNLVWPLQNVVALVIFILLINDLLLATLLWIACTLIILVVVYTINDTLNQAEITRVYLEPMPLYAFILIVGSLAMRNRKIIEVEKLRAMAQVTGNMAHELRTPLLAIKALAQGIGIYLPNLIRAYDLAIANDLGIEPIRKRQLERLRTSLREIEVETDHSNVIIDRLLINTTERPFEDHPFEHVSAQHCVIEAIRRYPFAGDHERDLISFDLDRNFMIHAPPMLMVHVLFNLLKNSIYYVQKAGKGDVIVKFAGSSRTRANAIVIEDTGTGIAPQHVRRIFERFYSTSNNDHGSGIGLSFCKAVMEGLGGSITCESRYGVYTRFTLNFPWPRHV